MKNRIIALIIGALFASSAVQAAQVQEVKYTAIPYEDIINILKDDNVLVVLDLIRVKGIAQGIANSLTGIQTFDLDIKKATEAAKNFKMRAQCLRLPATTVAKDKNKQPIIDTATGKPKIISVRSVVPQCQNVGCAGDRAACIKALLQDMKILLKPLVQDVFTGYTDSNGKPQQGLTFALFDIINQPQLKDNADFKKTVQILQIIMNVLDIIEKAIPTPSTTKQ